MSKLTQWYTLKDDLYGIFSRCERIIGTVEKLIADTPCHFHSKMMLKEKCVGGAWQWHQDYGYWYDGEGFLFPDKMVSCYVAVDRAGKDNGCLQVLKGSHKMGRIHHHLAGDQACADLQRVAQCENVFEKIYCEVEPGSTIFFHPNLLHRSDQNRSDCARWSLISCYTGLTNLPYKDTKHPGYKPVNRVPDCAIKQKGSVVAQAGNRYIFFDQSQGFSTKSI